MLFAVFSIECSTFVVSFEKTGGISFVGSLRVRGAGGNSNNSTNAGASYTNANYTATNANANYSSPLYFAVRDKKQRRYREMSLAPWQKITANRKGVSRT